MGSQPLPLAGYIFEGEERSHPHHTTLTSSTTKCVSLTSYPLDTRSLCLQILFSLLPPRILSAMSSGIVSLSLCWIHPARSDPPPLHSQPCTAVQPVASLASGLHARAQLAPKRGLTPPSGTAWPPETPSVSASSRKRISVLHSRLKAPSLRVGARRSNHLCIFTARLLASIIHIHRGC